MKAMAWLVVGMLVGCGGSVEPADAGSDAGLEATDVTEAGAALLDAAGCGWACVSTDGSTWWFNTCSGARASCAESVARCPTVCELDASDQ